MSNARQLFRSIVVAATLGVAVGAALAPTSAFAFAKGEPHPGGGRSSGGYPGGGHPGGGHPGYPGGGHPGYPGGGRPGGHPGYPGGYPSGGRHPHWPSCSGYRCTSPRPHPVYIPHRPPCMGYRCSYPSPYPVYVPPVVVTRPAPVYIPQPQVAVTPAAPAYVPPAPAGNCNCLTKEYTQDGNVVFRDLCTNEAAAAQVQQSPGPQGQGY